MIAIFVFDEETGASKVSLIIPTVFSIPVQKSYVWLAVHALKCEALPAVFPPLKISFCASISKLELSAGCQVLLGPTSCTDVYLFVEVHTKHQYFHSGHFELSRAKSQFSLQFLCLKVSSSTFELQSVLNNLPSISPFLYSFPRRERHTWWRNLCELGKGWSKSSLLFCVRFIANFQVTKCPPILVGCATELNDTPPPCPPLPHSLPTKPTSESTKFAV